MPIVREAGIDPVYFGMLFIMNNAIGLITPPAGCLSDVAHHSQDEVGLAAAPWRSSNARQFESERLRVGKALYESRPSGFDITRSATRQHADVADLGMWA